jgi:hypothetical protein
LRPVAGLAEAREFGGSDPMRQCGASSFVAPAVAGHDRPGGHPSYAAIQFERNRFAARIAVCLFTFVQIIDFAST